MDYEMLIREADRLLFTAFGIPIEKFCDLEPVTIHRLLEDLEKLRPWRYALSDVVEKGQCYIMKPNKIAVIHPGDEDAVVRGWLAAGASIERLGKCESGE